MFQSSTNAVFLGLQTAMKSVMLGDDVQTSLFLQIEITLLRIKENRRHFHIQMGTFTVMVDLRPKGKGNTFTVIVDLN